jgi:hypothetical protein
VRLAEAGYIWYRAAPVLSPEEDEMQRVRREKEALGVLQKRKEELQQDDRKNEEPMATEELQQGGTPVERPKEEEV